MYGANDDDDMVAVPSHYRRSHLTSTCPKPNTFKTILLYLDFSVGSGSLTTPEEAQAFLASQRNKLKETNAGPPAHLSADGIDAWYMQQRNRDKEMRRRRNEAEAMLRGYRMTMSHGKQGGGSNPEKDDPATLSPVRNRLFENHMTDIDETMEDPDSEAFERRIGKLTMKEAEEKEDGGDAEKTTSGPEGSTEENGVVDKGKTDKSGGVAVAGKAKPTSLAEPSSMVQWRGFVEPGEAHTHTHTHAQSFSRYCVRCCCSCGANSVGLCSVLDPSHSLTDCLFPCLLVC